MKFIKELKQNILTLLQRSGFMSDQLADIYDLLKNKKEAPKKKTRVINAIINKRPEKKTKCDAKKHYATISKPVLKLSPMVICNNKQVPILKNKKMRDGKYLIL